MRRDRRQRCRPVDPTHQHRRAHKSQSGHPARDINRLAPAGSHRAHNPDDECDDQQNSDDGPNQAFVHAHDRNTRRHCRQVRIRAAPGGRKRHKLGLCLTCAYDFRASLDRCRKCGTRTASRSVLHLQAPVVTLVQSFGVVALDVRRFPKRRSIGHGIKRICTTRIGPRLAQSSCALLRRSPPIPSRRPAWVAASHHTCSHPTCDRRTAPCQRACSVSSSS